MMTSALSYRSALLGEKPTMKTSTYLHLSYTRIERVHDRLEQPSADSKPIGLWLSSGTAWKDWCDEQCFFPYDMQKTFVYAASINEKNLFVIDTFKKLIEFCEKYGVMRRFNNGINWALVAKNYDGIVIRNYRQIWDRCFQLGDHIRNITSWFRTFDIDSACIWRARSVRLFQTKWDV